MPRNPTSGASALQIAPPHDTMILTLLAVSLNDQALTRPITGRFDAAGGTIGRADHSTLALPDPERYISRKQAEVVFAGNGFLIRNVGAANPITVAQRALAAGDSTPLRDGDEVRIGGYLLRAECRSMAQDGPAASEGIPATVVSNARASAPGAAAWGAPVQPASRRSPGSPASPRPPARSPPPPAPALPPAFAARAPLASDNPFADLLGPAAPDAGAHGPPPVLPDDDPFAGLMPAPAGLDPALGGVGRTGRAAPALLPDDVDPFASSRTPRAADPANPETPMASAAGTTSGADDPFADLLGSASGRPAGSPSIDQAFGLAGGGDDALARFAAAPAPSARATGGAGGDLSTDPLMLFGEGGDAARTPATPAAWPETGPAALPDHLPALHGAYAPPRVPGAAGPAPAAARPRGGAPYIPATIVAQPASAPAPAAAPRAAAPASPGRASPATASGDAAALWRAFCEGTGVDLPLPPGEGEALMRHIGRILRSAVEGTLQLVSVRASTKHEMRAAVTQIQATSNNPLKFSSDAASAVEQLLSPPQRGFLDGASAMDDAMLDLVGHSIGTVAGMRAAIEGMLERFEPAALESKLGAGSPLANLLPMNRKARLWELYLQHHRQIRDEAEDDFHTLFGRAFVAAYEQQVERLERQQEQRRQQQPRR